MNRKGFTLIELVMVIVIIGILAAIAIPRFVNLRDDAVRAACLGNVGTLRSAVSAFYARSAVQNMMAQQGFPLTLTSLATSVNRHNQSFIVGDVLPTCPRNNSSYVTLGIYSNATGVVADHTH